MTTGLLFLFSGAQLALSIPAEPKSLFRILEFPLCGKTLIISKTKAVSKAFPSPEPAQSGPSHTLTDSNQSNQVFTLPSVPLLTIALYQFTQWLIFASQQS